MKIAEVNKKFKNTWVLAKVLKEDELNQPVEVKPIMASDNRDKLYDKIGTLPKGITVTTFYTGKVRGAFIFFYSCQA